jgi:hypothetical protein
MKKAGDKPKNENDDFDDGEWADDPEQHAVVKAQQPARYPEAVLRAIERNPAMRADIIADYKRKQGVAEQFEMPGTTIPQKSVIRGYVVYYNPKTQVVSITRRGDSEEAAIEQARLGKPSMLSFETTVSKLINRIEQDLVENEKKGLYYYVNKRKKAGTNRPASSPKAPTAQAWKDAAKTAKTESIGDSSTSTDEAESAILKRIMVAHLDLLREFGPEKVMQAVEEVAYGVGDLDEIGSSDVSGWVHQVKNILGAE